MFYERGVKIIAITKRNHSCITLAFIIQYMPQLMTYPSYHNVIRNLLNRDLSIYKFEILTYINPVTPVFSPLQQCHKDWLSLHYRRFDVCFKNKANGSIF